MIKNVVIPLHLRKGIGKNDNGFNPRCRVFGADTETVDGDPYTLQIAGADFDSFDFVDGDSILPTFLNVLEPRLLVQGFNVCYFHYLPFDMTALLINHKERFLEGSGFEINQGRAVIQVMHGKRWWARIQFPDRKVLMVLDSYAFVFSSLEKIAEKLKLPTRKLPKPAGLGTERLTSKEFIDYATNDARTEYHLGEWIVDQHREYDVRMCISLPQFAGRVMRHHFFKADETIPFPNQEVVDASILSYHGGKNGCYVKPGFYRDVVEADISSAYPWAMATLPQFVRGVYMKSSHYVPGYPGVWCVSGFLTGSCRYPIFFSHDFKPLLKGRVENLWVTSDELEEALRTGEFVLHKAAGYYWKPEPGYDHSPLEHFVAEFYRKKESCAADDPQRVLYKLLLNSLYGKFIQTMEQEPEEAAVSPDDSGKFTVPEKVFKAGGLFNPFLATQITGRVRAQVHKLEVKYEALHTATDSIKTRQKVVVGTGLGSLGEVVSGPCLILRNKLYVHWDAEGRVKKYALHGFEGKIADLLKLVKTKEKKYDVVHLWKIKEALRLGRKPLAATVRRRVLNVDYPELPADFQVV